MPSNNRRLPWRNSPILWIGSYFGVTGLCLSLASPTGLAAIPVQFYLQEQLHLAPMAFAIASALMSLPMLLGFIWGLLRDQVQPRGWGDRAYYIPAAVITTGAYLWLAAAPLTYGRLVGAMFVATVGAAILNAALTGLTTVVAQHHGMTGRLGALGLFTGMVPGIIGALAGGWLTTHVPLSNTLYLGGALSALFLGLAFWTPAIIFKHVPTASETRPAAEPLLASMKRLLRHRPLWVVLALTFLWLFTPGWGTPLFFYLTKTLGLTPPAVGLLRSFGLTANVAAALIYAPLSRRFPLSRLLLVGVLIAVVGAPAYLLVHSPVQAMIASTVLGFSCGLGNGAMADLFFRSCPKRLEGISNMLSAALSVGSALTSDLIGSWLYQRGGFGLAMLFTMSVTALMLPLLLLVPRRLVATVEGEHNELFTSSPAPALHPA